MSKTETLDTNDFFFRDDTGNAEIDLPLMHLEEAEKQLIVKALNKYYGNITEAAKELGLTRASLYRRLEKHKL